MANKRILDENIPNDFNDGQILYAEDLNQIVDVLKEGVNANKLDLDKILTGDSSAHVVYDFDSLYSIVSVSDGDFGYVYNPEVAGDGIKVYQYALESNLWVFKHYLDLKTLYELTYSVKKQYIQETEPEDWTLDELWFDISG